MRIAQHISHLLSDTRTRFRFIVFLIAFLTFASGPSPMFHTAYAASADTLEVLTTFQRVDQLDALRSELATHAARAIGLEHAVPHGEARYGGLTATQADAVMVIAEVFGAEYFEYAVRVAWCESRLDPSSINRGNGNHTVDRGLFQLNDGGTMQRLGVDTREVFDPRESAQAAWILFDDRGWQPWVCAKILKIDKLNKWDIARKNRSR